MYLRILLASLTILLLTGPVFAKGLPITPGKWEMTTTIEMSLLPQPQTKTYTECIEETEMNPEDFNMDEDSPCDITEVEFDGNSAKWSISCPNPMGAMEGEWEITSNGDSIVGGGSMSAEIAGQKMEMEMQWEGTRVGDCT